jgi:FAD/FMN-containing dehydrogenase
LTAHKRRALGDHLRRHLEGEVRFDRGSRRLYSTDASIYQVEPLGVVLPRTLADLHTAVQVAAEMRVPVTARGGGTSLSGQSIGPGLVVDCSKYLNNILDIDPGGRLARVQPGVVLDQLNRALWPHGLQFGPEVATASRANLGGLIGNNSAGARSIVYGRTLDHVRSLGIFLEDGTRLSLGPLTPADWERKAAERTREGGLYQAVGQVVRDHAEEIRNRFPRILRRVSGYNLDVLALSLVGGSGPGAPLAGLHQIVIGSEGTLAVVCEAELGLVPVPRARGLLVPHFASLEAATDAVAACLDYRPSAVELLDHMLLDLARANLSLRGTMAAVHGRPRALLMVEFSGDEPAEVADRVDKLRRRLDGVPGVTAQVSALEPAVRDPL